MRSTVQRIGWIGLAFVAVVGVAPDVVETQTSVADGLKASVGIRVTPYGRSGSVGGTYVGSDMLPGESGRLNVTVGHDDRLCTSGVWAADDPQFMPSSRMLEMERSALFVWRFDASVVEVGTDKITFDLVGERTAREAPARALRQSQRLTLHEGEFRPIDLLHGVPGGDCVSVVLEATASVIEDPALQGKTIEWDLWLQSDLQGAPMHRALTSPQGASATFAFDSIASSTIQPGGVNDVLVQVFGQLRGRVRADGSIDVALNTNRVTSWGIVNIALLRQFHLGRGFGEKNFTMKPGEAVKIVLPELSSSRPVQTKADPVTGEQKAAAAVRTGQSGSASSATSEMSLTVLARVE
jgi:hypothetical protein